MADILLFVDFLKKPKLRKRLYKITKTSRKEILLFLSKAKNKSLQKIKNRFNKKNQKNLHWIQNICRIKRYFKQGLKISHVSLLIYKNTSKFKKMLSI